MKFQSGTCDDWFAALLFARVTCLAHTCVVQCAYIKSGLQEAYTTKRI